MIFDKIFTIEVFEKANLFTFAERLPHLFYIVPLTILGSIILAMIVHCLSGAISKLVYKIMDKVILKKKEDEQTN